ncbi:DUF1045 domain-containing protein [Rhizobium sp. PAMB 3182]
MRYSIAFTPPPRHVLSEAAALWLGRDAFAGHLYEPHGIGGLGIHEIAFHTALPRRAGFHAMLQAPFRLKDDANPASLLKHMMTFAGGRQPFLLPPLEVARVGQGLGLIASTYPYEMHELACSVIHEFDAYRAPLSDVEIERRNPDVLNATEFANLHRWGHPHVMDEYRFHMMLTGALNASELERFERALKRFFAPALEMPLEVANLALMIEEEQGAPFHVHSLHPLGPVSQKKRA